MEIKHYSEIKEKHPDWNIGPDISTLEENPIYNCANCGVSMYFNASYTSRECMNDTEIFGLAVCDKCYKSEEWYRK